ncbi:unnamed protein product, partial [Sphacelaria rigidula]
MAEGGSSGSSGSSATTGGAAVQPNQHGRTTTTTTTTTAPPQQQHQSLSRPSSPPRPTGSPPPTPHSISKHHSSSMVQYSSGAISSQGNTAAAGVPWPPVGQRHRRASTGWDLQKDAGSSGGGGSGGHARWEGTRKGRFQIRDLPAASSAGSDCSVKAVSEEDDFAIPIVQDGKLVPSPLSTPRSRTRSRTEGHDPFPVLHDPRQGRDAASGEILSSTSTDAVVPYPSASAAAGAAGAVATAVVSATAGEPVKRQKGRFKLRDLGEIQSGPPTPVAGALGGSGGVGGAAVVAVGQGQLSQQSQTPAQLPGTLSDVSISTAGEQQPTGVVVAPGAGAAAATASPVAVAPLDVQASIILLMEQNRQILDKLATLVPETSAPSTLAAAAVIASGSAAQTQATVATATAAAAVAVESRYQFVSNNNPPPGVDRSRTSSMTALTLQTPLPPKPPNLYGAGSSGDRNVSPLTRDTPSGWWGSQPAQVQPGPGGGGGAQGSAGGGGPQG